MKILLGLLIPVFWLTMPSLAEDGQSAQMTREDFQNMNVSLNLARILPLASLWIGVDQIPTRIFE